MNALVNELSDQVSGTLHKTIPFTKGFHSKFLSGIQSCYIFSNIDPAIICFVASSCACDSWTRQRAWTVPSLWR